MKLSIYYPVSPLHINQPFGANPQNYSKFLDQFGKPELGHMGIDLMATHGEPVYAAFAGTAFYVKDDHGGEGVYVRSDMPYEYSGGECWFNGIYWHLIGDTDPKFQPPISMNGIMTKVQAGDLIGHANNTGAPFESSGDHLHFGLMPCDVNGKAVAPANGFGGCIDPAPYFNDQFAVNIKINLYKKAIDIAQKILAILLKQKGSPTP